MQKKRMGLVALVIMALMVSSVVAWVILEPTKVVGTDYSVKPTEATWEAWVEGNDKWICVSPPLTLDLGELNGAETGYASGYIKLTVTTYAPVKVTFGVDYNSSLGGLQSGIVRIWYAGEYDDITSEYPSDSVVFTPTGSLSYEFTIEVWGTAIDYTEAPIEGYINLYALVETAPLP